LLPPDRKPLYGWLLQLRPFWLVLPKPIIVQWLTPSRLPFWLGASHRSRRAEGVIFRKSEEWEVGLAFLADLRNVHLYQARIRKAAQVLFRGTSLLKYKFQSPTFEPVKKIALLPQDSDRGMNRPFVTGIGDSDSICVMPILAPPVLCRSCDMLKRVYTKIAASLSSTNCSPLCIRQI
jgi:hypothetical protein